MVSLPTRGTNLRLTASSATRRTVQRARPASGLLHTIAIKRCSGFRRALQWRLASVFPTAHAPTLQLVPAANITYGLGTEWD